MTSSRPSPSRSAVGAGYQTLFVTCGQPGSGVPAPENNCRPVKLNADAATSALAGSPSNSPSDISAISPMYTGQPGTGLPSPFQAYIGPELTPGASISGFESPSMLPTTKDVVAAPTEP